MRASRLWVALLAASCFSESPSSSACVDGDAACDCKSDGTCNDGNECIVSIDKCVPSGCTPGGESCTCVDGDCLGDLVCGEGVCMAPDAASTGGTGATTGSVSDSVAETITEATTMPATSASSDPTIPPDTMSSDVTDAMTASASSDPTDPSDPTVVSETSQSESDSDSASSECPACIEGAVDDDCSEPFGTCYNANNGCNDVYDCVTTGGDVTTCCAHARGPAARADWNALIECVQMHDCAGNCHPTCN